MAQRTIPMTRNKLSFAFVTFLTFVRLPLVLLFAIGAVIQAVKGAHTGLFTANLSLLVAASLTDLFDGYFARKLNVTTKFGAYADPFNDKIFFILTLLALIFVTTSKGHTVHGVLLVSMAAIFFVRDQWVSFLRSIGSKYGAEAKANWWGKARTFLGIIVICVAYFFEESGTSLIPARLLHASELAVIAITVISGWIYSKYYWPFLVKSAAPE